MLEACVFAIMCSLSGLKLIIWRQCFPKVPTGTKFTGHLPPKVLLVRTKSSYIAKRFFSFGSDPPSITHIIHDRIVNETDVVQLNCTADDSPLPTIRWTRVLDNNSVSKVLQIAGKQEEGLYSCTAENGIGNAAKQDVNITVLCKSNS